MKKPKIGFLGSVSRTFKSVTRAFQIPNYIINANTYAKPPYQKTAEESSKRLRDSVWTTACIHKYATAVSAVTFIAQEWSEEEEAWIRVPGHHIENLMVRPNGYQTSSEFMAVILTNLLKDGNALISIIDSKISKQTEKLEALNSDGVFPKLDPIDLIESYEVRKGHWGVNTQAFSTFVPREEMVHIKFPNSENLEWGISPLEAAENVQDGEARAIEWNKSLMSPSGRPNYVLTTPDPLSRRQKSDIAAALREDMELEGNGFPTILTHGIKPISVGSTPVELDYVESSLLDEQRICALLQVPPPLIGDARNSTLANLREYIKLFWTSSIIPLLTMMCQAFTHYWIQPRWGDNFRVWYDLSNVIELKEDLKEKVEIVESLLNYGYSMNELNRNLEMHLPEIESGDIRRLGDEVIDWGGFTPVSQEVNEIGGNKKPEELNEEEAEKVDILEKDVCMLDELMRPRLVKALKPLVSSLCESNLPPDSGGWKDVTLMTLEREVDKCWYSAASAASVTFAKMYNTTPSEFSKEEKKMLADAAKSQVSSYADLIVDVVSKAKSQHETYPDLLTSGLAKDIVGHCTMNAINFANSISATKTTELKNKIVVTRPRPQKGSYGNMKTEIKSVNSKYENTDILTKNGCFEIYV